MKRLKPEQVLRSERRKCNFPPFKEIKTERPTNQQTDMRVTHPITIKKNSLAPTLKKWIYNTESISTMTRFGRNNYSTSTQIGAWK